MKSPVLLAVLLLNTGVVFGQLGGKRMFEFLNLPTNARTAGLGGVVVSATQSDPTMFLSNPALLSEKDHNMLSMSHLGFYADVKYSSFTYARRTNKLGTIGVGIQRMSYGSIDSYDASGNVIGKFDAAETALTISKSHRLGPFALGANLKFVQSGIYTFSASALLMDIGGTFTHPEKELVVAMTMKNLGVLLSDYTATSSGNLPLDVQVGVTFKPQYMPFRFTFTAYNLNREGVTFVDPDIQDEDDQPGQVDKIFRHANIGMEIVFSQNFNLRFGYNHLLRKELRLTNTAGGAGFNFGFMARIKAFELAYTNTTYHSAGGKSYITVTTNMNKIFKKKTKE